MGIKERTKPSQTASLPLFVCDRVGTPRPRLYVRAPAAPADNLRGTNRIAIDEPLICRFAIICLLMSIFAPDFVRLI